MTHQTFYSLSKNTHTTLQSPRSKDPGGRRLRRVQFGCQEQKRSFWCRFQEETSLAGWPPGHFLASLTTKETEMRTVTRCRASRWLSPFGNGRHCSPGSALSPPLGRQAPSPPAGSGNAVAERSSAREAPTLPTASLQFRTQERGDRSRAGKS